MSDRNKLVFGAIIIISWIGFWRWADSTLPEETRIEVTQSKNSQEVCSDLINKKNSLEDTASNMAKEANDLQRSLLRGRLTEIINKDILSRNEDKILSEYISYDLKKIVAEKSDAFGDALLRNIELKPQSVKIVNKLIKNGELEPYWFEEVQQMGQDLRAKFQEARDLTEANPDCFKSTLDIDKLIDEATSKLEQGEAYNGWIAKHTAEELVDSIL
jgi:polyhydroxyalkanoate synthesis regulator phasin